jgi:hypothetical protein
VRKITSFAVMLAHCLTKRRADRKGRLKGYSRLSLFVRFRRPVMRKLLTLALLALSLAGGLAVVSVEQSSTVLAECNGCG